MEHLHNPEALSCDAVAQMLELSFDDMPLTSEQTDLVHRHALDCRDCQNLLGLMHELRGVSDALQEADFDGKISLVQKTWQYLRPTQSARIVRWSVLGASIAAAALLLFGLWQIWGISDASESLSTEAFTVPCTPDTVLSPVDGVYITHCRELTTPQTMTREGEVSVILTQGSVALYVNPARIHPQAVVVRTPRGEIRVKGTVFAVHVTEQDERVEVFRGTVELWTDDGDSPSLRVSAGMGATVHSLQKYALENPVRKQLVGALEEHYIGKSAAHQVTPDMPVSHEVASDKSTEKLKSAVSGSEPQPTSGMEKKSFRASPGRVESMESLLDAARFCLIENDWSCAKDKYTEALRRHPHHPAISAVRISLAKLELRRLNSPRKALGHYHTYLQKNPNGSLAEEALLGMANAQRQMHNKAKEVEALRRLLSQFPHSVMAPKVRHRLAQLEAQPPG